MSAREIVDFIAEKGHRLELREGDRVVVIPKLTGKLEERARARKADIRAFLAEHGGVWPPQPADHHRLVVWSGVRLQDRAFACCIACGISADMHGANALDAAIVVDDVDSVALLEARAIIIAASAAELAR